MSEAEPDPAAEAVPDLEEHLAQLAGIDDRIGGRSAFLDAEIVLAKIAREGGHDE